MSTEVLVTKAEVLGAHKGMNGKDWWADVRLELEDGASMETTFGAYSTRKAALADDHNPQDRRRTYVRFSANGFYEGKTTKYGLGRDLA